MGKSLCALRNRYQQSRLFDPIPGTFYYAVNMQDYVSLISVNASLDRIYRISLNEDDISVHNTLKHYDTNMSKRAIRRDVKIPSL